MTNRDGFRLYRVCSPHQEGSLRLVYAAQEPALAASNNPRHLIVPVEELAADTSTVNGHRDLLLAQAESLRELADQLDEEFGPIPEDIRKEAAALLE